MTGPGSAVRPGGPGPRYRPGWWLAVAAAVIDLAYAAISAYWGLGGTWLLATVSASLATGRQGATVIAGVWVAVVLKAVGALIPLLACGPTRHSTWHRRLRVVAWAEGVVLIGYGFVLTSVELAAEAGLIHPGRSADRRALAWHAYLWDPWFLVWGLVVVVALVLTRTAATGTTRGRSIGSPASAGTSPRRRNPPD